MHVFEAHVKDGRIELDEPADLPEGAELQVTLVQSGEELSAEDWASIDEGIADFQAGRVVDRASVHDRIPCPPRSSSTQEELA
jgi:hypothetical protein